MSKKIIIIISIAAVIIIASGIFLTLWFTQRETTQAPAPDATVVVPDYSEDYGACTLVTKDQITSALGSVADTLKDAYDSGKLFYSENVKAQYCSYDFTDKAEDGNFRAEVSVYITEANADATEDLLKTDTTLTMIPLDSGDGFYRSYTDQKDPEAAPVKHFTLTFFADASQYTLSINQLESSVTFNDMSATKALITLANEATIDK